MTTKDPKVGVSVGIPYSVVQIIDKLRGGMPRAEYIRKMVIETVAPEYQEVKPA